MARLEKVEREAGDFKRVLSRLTTILVDQSERIDRVSERVDRVSERVDQLGGKVDQLGTKVDELGMKVDHVGDRLSERLDRLIAVTIQERTYSVERTIG